MKHLNKIILLNFLTFFFFSNLFSNDLNNPLPNWIDKNREISDGKGPSIDLKRTSVPSDFRIPAEYEKISAVVLSWSGYTSMLTEIAKASAKANAQVWVLQGPSTLSGIGKDFYFPLDIRINSVWVRDYGPFGISSKDKKVAIIDTVYRHYQYRRDDDMAPKNIGLKENIPVYSANLILDGGNFMVDSYSNLFMTERTYLWNSSKSKEEVNNILKDTFKVKNIYTFEYAGYPNEPYDGTGHIDMFMKLLNDHTVLIATLDQEPFKSNSEKAISFFKDKTAPDGQKYKVITVKGWYSENSGTYYTYTNSLIVNNTVIIPSYSSHDDDNRKAIEAYKKALPNINVIAVNSDSSIVSGGSIHCTTQTIPDFVKISKSENEVLNLKLKDFDKNFYPLPKTLTNFSF